MHNILLHCKKKGEIIEISEQIKYKCNRTDQVQQWKLDGP